MDSTRTRPASEPTLLASSLLYLLSGVAFGIIAYKSQIISWYRIQEMFRFDSFHMYGVMISAVAVGAVSTWIMKRAELRSMSGKPVAFEASEPMSPRFLLGGTVFGVGWALTGACPGPIYALIGSGFGGFIVVLMAALLGTWTYAQLRGRLPH